MSVRRQARGSFCNLESVLAQLVQSVLSVAEAGRRAGRRRSLAAACIAYCFVTLPALEDVLLRTRLYTVTAQVALVCRCPGQGETGRQAGRDVQVRPLSHQLCQCHTNILTSLSLLATSTKREIRH